MVYGDCIYGEGVYGEGCSAPVVVLPSPPYQIAIPGHTGKCVCGNQWRFEACDIFTGKVKAVLHPVSVNWEEKESTPGNGQITLASQDLRPDNIFPHRTTIYISQVVNGERVGRWAGIVEDYDTTAGGAAQVDLKGIDNYINQRNLADTNGGVTLTFAQVYQTEIAAQLAHAALDLDGITLEPVAGQSFIKRDRTYNSWDFKNIGEAITQLTDVIDGPKYRLQHEYLSGYWNTKILFLDTAGADRGISLLGGREGATYGVRVDAKDQATWAFGIGEGEEKLQKVSIAFDEAEVYPRFDAVPAWKDVSVQATLDAHTQGYVVNHRDPVATPNMTIPGLDPSPENLQLGDRVYVQFNYGLTSFDGYCKILSIGWTLTEGAPIYRALSFIPELRPVDSVRLEDPVIEPPTTPPDTDPTDPDPTPGLVSRMTDTRITESSGMAHSEEF